METKSNAKASTPNSRDENLTCCQMATNPQCLQVETTSEIHLFPYGYFQHAKFSRRENIDVIEIRFQDVIVIASGKNFEVLCQSLARLSVQAIKAIPKKYHFHGNKNEISIDTVEIKQIKQEAFA